MGIGAICTPVLLKKESDLRTRVDFLKKGIDGKFPLGIEVIGSLDDFTDPDIAETIAQNAEQARKLGIDYIVVHAPVTRGNYENAPTSLVDPDISRLEKVMELAEKIRAATINFHAEVFMRRDQMAKLLTKVPLYEKISRTLTELGKKALGVNINIENMPWPLMGDVFMTPGEMIYDPVFHNLDELWLFCYGNIIEMTLDTCHWGTTVDSGRDLVGTFSEMKKYINHVHLSDVRGKWVDGESIFEEGVPLGEGKLGEHLGDFVRFMKADRHWVSVTLEINDHDFAELAESRRSLDKLMEWLA